MNVLKNMEAIFVVAFALVSATSFATAAIPAAHVPAKVEVSKDAEMVVLTITAKRLTPAQKAKLLAE